MRDGIGSGKRALHTGLLAATLVFLTVSCSSRNGTVSRVYQAGLQLAPAPAPAESTPAASIPPFPSPIEENGPAEVVSASAEIKPQPEAAPAPALEVHAVAEPVPVPDPPVTSNAMPEAVPEEMDPSPELVSAEDDELIEEIESARASMAQTAAPVMPKVEYDIPLENHARVLDYIEIFQTSRRESFIRGLSRSRKYEHIIKPILREVGVPTDLYYLALIESAFNPRAYSRSRAMGIWQFIYTTGKAYGLRRNHWLDERRDPVKATHAAARHLRDLHRELGSWPLALAGYNAGVNRVKRAIRRGGTRDFWTLRLPSQTRNYVPAFYAALIIAKDPERYGFNIEYDPPVRYETATVDGGTRLSLVAAFCHTSVKEIRGLNPEIRQGCAPPGPGYTLKIPSGTGEAVLAGLARTPRTKITGWGSYRIRTGDTLSSIARRHGTTVEAIQEVNNMPGTFIRAGRTIMIPGNGIAGGAIPEIPDIGSALPSSGKYAVRRGDSLWSISRRFGLSHERLAAINGIHSGDILRVGQVLRLRPDPGRRQVASSEADGAGGVTYRVRKGDSLWGIARKFDADLKTLLRVNGLRRGQTIYPGERLVIPGGGAL